MSTKRPFGPSSPSQSRERKTNMVDYIALLKKEVCPAEGCTEPVAVAFAVSLAAEQLDVVPSSVNLKLSANIIKNALGVGIPGTGMVGIEIAAALGAVIRQSAKKLEVLQGFSAEQLDEAKAMVDAKIIRVEQKQTPEALYIEASVEADGQTGRVIVCRDHTNVVRVEKNGEVVLDKPISIGECGGEESTGLTVDGIYEFATTVPFEDVKFILDCVELNTRVSEEGLSGDYGLEVGKRMGAGANTRGVLLNNLSLRLISATAAASDARMGGCPLSVMTCAGSGNQGLASSLPIIELSRVLGSSDEDLARALVISDLVVMHIKEYMGRLSPLCGSGIAGGTGACCGMTYLQGGNLPEIKCAVNNMLATLQGMICDGAKATCALKIAAGTNAAIMSSTLALADIQPSSMDGIVFDDAEQTIQHTGKLVREGFATTDEAILSIMLAKQLEN